MSNVMALLYFAWASCMLLFDNARGDVCLACVDSPVTRACHYTRTCESHENCFADAFENQNGDTIFDMGCRDIQLCGTSGKRKVENRSNGNTLICSKCCTGNICNAALCGQTGLPSAGPVCFHCDQASTPSTCNTIALCGRDDVCYVEKFIDALSRDTLYKSGCLHKIQCDKHANTLSLIGRKRYENTVMSGNDLQIQCCDSYLCNHGNVSANLGSPLTSGTVVPTHYSHSTNTNLCSSSPCIHGNCFSGSAGYLCQCEHGWQGKNCEQRQGPCSSAPCAHGICFESSIDYVCQCENGWTGKNCDQGQGPCSRAPCAHGNCFESSIDYVCQCENGWTGKNCDQVYGHWGSWSAWSFCTSNCNQTRTRACDNPAPLHGGRDCPGLTTQTQECPISKCQANDCSELLSSFAVRLSGVYTITTPLTHSKIEVLCDMKTDGGGWTVFQKRFDGSENFYRNFSDYENGFGSVHTEHWLGLKYIYEITSRGSYQLRVDILRSNGSNGYDVHGNFSLQPGTNYTLNIGSRLRSNDVDSTYSFTETTGTAPVGNAFSTYDHDVDRDESNCAALFKGGWWYNGCYGYINLNGVYKPGQYDTSAMRYDSRISINASTIMFKRV